MTLPGGGDIPKVYDSYLREDLCSEHCVVNTAGKSEHFMALLCRLLCERSTRPDGMTLLRGMCVTVGNVSKRID